MSSRGAIRSDIVQFVPLLPSLLNSSIAGIIQISWRPSNFDGSPPAPNPSSLTEPFVADPRALIPYLLIVPNTRGGPPCKPPNSPAVSQSPPFGKPATVRLTPLQTSSPASRHRRARSPALSSSR